MWSFPLVNSVVIITCEWLKDCSYRECGTLERQGLVNINIIIGRRKLVMA